MKLTDFVFGAIPLLIQFYATKYENDDKAATLEELEGDLGLPRIKTYDFIVVGGGTAGCVIASRLSERFNVLLLETGGPPSPMSDVPYFNSEVTLDVATNYQFNSVPQRYAALSAGGIIASHSGKMLGGSGSHNDGIHNRGSPLDYDNYARILNDDSWSYANLLEYFKKSENFIGKLFTEDYIENYGHDGPIVVDTEVPPFLEPWFEAGEELGFRRADPNGYQVESFAPLAKSIDKGQRSSAYTHYLKPHMARVNLTVHPYSFAHEILIDKNNKAYGVAYERHSIPQIAYASKEVIVSAGSFGSPLLLMKSGVGPRDQLEAADIPVKHELPLVGQNLQDHAYVQLKNIVTYNNSAVPLIPLLPEGKDFEEMLQKYQETGEGILGNLKPGPQALLVSSRAKQDGQDLWPDIQLVFRPFCYPFSTVEDPFSCALIMNPRPKSRGSVSLNATAYKNGLRSDMDLAVIDFKLFENEGQSDVDVFLEGIQHQLRILNTTAFRSLGAKYSEGPFPACDSHDFLSENYWRCYVGQNSFAGFHASGTCSLGGVVDSQFRVDGISNLRVADASIFPASPNSHINAGVIMIGEKASADILRTYV